MEKRQFDTFQMDVNNLLKYAIKEGVRVGDALVSQLNSFGCQFIITGVDKEHQATNLIDMDIRLAQGEIISKPRPLLLYANGNKAGEVSDINLSAES